MTLTGFTPTCSVFHVLLSDLDNLISVFGSDAAHLCSDDHIRYLSVTSSNVLTSNKRMPIPSTLTADIFTDRHLWGNSGEIEMLHICQTKIEIENRSILNYRLTIIAYGLRKLMMVNKKGQLMINEVDR